VPSRTRSLSWTAASVCERAVHQVVAAYSPSPTHGFGSDLYLNPLDPGFGQGTGGPVTWVPWAAQGPVGTRGTRCFDLT
jgi:hypothetical protein